MRKKQINSYKKIIRPGDILLVGDKIDPVASLIKIGTLSKWNHAAIVIDNKHIVESCAKGIFISPISKYFKPIYNIKFLRTKLSKNDLQTVVDIAKNSLRKHNLWIRFISFWIVGLGIKVKIPCITCSGFVASCFASVGYIFCNKNLAHITPKNIDKCRRLKHVRI